MRQAQKTIMVADDDPAILDALTLILEDAGYVVKATCDGETIRNAHTLDPDLLLLDIRLSGWNGKDLCMSLKNTPGARSFPILLFSANRETGTLALEAGADDFITKPFDLDELLEKVEYHLARGDQ